MADVWRVPDEETVGLYPGLVVHDGRMGGRMTLGRSRLPASSMLAVPEDEYPVYTTGYDEPMLTRAQLETFVGDLLDMRGEFARLLLVLADAERRSRGRKVPWWQTKVHRQRVGQQLIRCLNKLAPID